MRERLCPECANPLYRHEGERCFPCWQYDVLRFRELFDLGAIGGRLRGITYL